MEVRCEPEEYVYMSGISGGIGRYAMGHFWRPVVDVYGLGS